MKHESSTTNQAFHAAIAEGIPSELPPFQARSEEWSHAPIRKDILTAEEKKLALRNALRYFPADQHEVLAQEFAQEL